MEIIATNFELDWTVTLSRRHVSTHELNFNGYFSVN